MNRKMSQSSHMHATPLLHTALLLNMNFLCASFLCTVHVQCRSHPWQAHTHTHARINQDRTRRTQTDKQTDRHIPASAVLLTSRGEYQLRIGLGGHVQLDEVRRRICLRLLMSGGNRNLCSYSTTREHTLSIETREAFSVTNCRTNTVLRVCRILCITNRILSL